MDLAGKLQIKPSQRLRVIGAPDAIAGQIGGVASGPYDGAVVFCETVADVETAAQDIVLALPEDCLLWFAYRKGPAAKASGLNRDIGWRPLTDLGLRTVRSISFDDVWTGLRFRPTARVKSK